MKLKQVQRKEELKSIRLNLKTTSRASKWMKENNVSPQMIFDLAVVDLMEANK